jgi:hypothetical protein
VSMEQSWYERYKDSLSGCSKMGSRRLGISYRNDHSKQLDKMRLRYKVGMSLQTSDIRLLLDVANVGFSPDFLVSQDLLLFVDKFY